MTNQWASASMYRGARECIDFPSLQERAAALSYALEAP